MKPRRTLPAFLLALCLALTSGIRATSLDPLLTETIFSSTGSTPTQIGWAPDGSNRLFSIQKGSNPNATVRTIQYNTATATGTLNPTVWATISPVFTNSECGLIGFCFDPNFLNNRYIYFFVTVSNSEQQIIRYTDNPGNNEGGNKTIIVSGLPTTGQNHDGGGVAVGPDGKIYWSIGDNGTPITGVDNDLGSLAAKVGRANRFTGAVPNDNPFFDDSGSNNDYIWARGFRNPFTMVFQRNTGKLWLNVVGSSYGGGTNPASGPGYEQVLIVERGSHGGWNDWENNQPAGYLTPVIAYRTGGSTTVNIPAGGAARNGGVVTFTTVGFHPFRPGAKATIAGVTNNSFNGSFYVANRLSDTQFTVTQAGPNAVSGGGTATTLQVGTFSAGPPATGGASLTGGAFYDSTAAPAAYHGNFFAGDSVTSRMLRATIDGATNQVTSVDLVVDNSGISFSQVDTAVGPDGAIYYVGINNSQVRRLAYNGGGQNVVLHPTSFNVVEGGSALFTVRLAQNPGSNVTVTIAKLSGDADLTASAASLTFTSANWNQLQTVTISGAEDADFDNDSAIFRVTSSGLATYDVLVNGIDNDDPMLVISRANLTVGEGGTGTFTVRLASDISSSVTVNVTRVSGDTDVSVSSGATLTFNSANDHIPQTVTIAAAEDADVTPDAAVIAITLAGDPARTVNITTTDNEIVAPAFTTTPPTTAVVNQPYSYDVDVSGNPAPQVTLTTRPTGMQLNAPNNLITWTPAATGTFNVTLQAANGTPPMATQSYQIVVSADAAPAASITSPSAGAVLTGSNAEFFGNGLDDAGTVQAEFFVDGVLRFTDAAAGGHYHYGGTHNLFDTTQFANGPHTLMMRVTDAAGQTGSASVQVTIGNGFNGWKAQNFTVAEQADPAISGDDADPDGDRIWNLMEYALNLPPKFHSLAGLPGGQVQNLSGSDYLTLSFTRVKWATDLTYTVEVTGDLTGPWADLDPLLPANQISVQEDTPSIGLQTITVRDNTPLSQTVTRRFMRLRVNR